MYSRCFIKLTGVMEYLVRDSDKCSLVMGEGMTFKKPHDSMVTCSSVSCAFDSFLICLIFHCSNLFLFLPYVFYHFLLRECLISTG